MKKVVIALVFAGGITAIAFASLGNRASVKDKNTDTEKKQEMKKEKKECKRTCIFG
jgi:hypothetical protein